MNNNCCKINQVFHQVKLLNRKKAISVQNKLIIIVELNYTMIIKNILFVKHNKANSSPFNSPFSYKEKGVRGLSSKIDKKK